MAPAVNQSDILPNETKLNATDVLLTFFFFFPKKISIESDTKVIRCFQSHKQNDESICQGGMSKHKQWTQLPLRWKTGKTQQDRKEFRVVQEDIMRPTLIPTEQKHKDRKYTKIGKAFTLRLISSTCQEHRTQINLGSGRDLYFTHSTVCQWSNLKIPARTHVRRVPPAIVYCASIKLKGSQETD